MLRHALARRLVAVLIALAMLAGGSIMPRAGQTVTPELAGFLAGGGQLSDICGLKGGAGGGHAGCQHCLLCHAIQIADTALTAARVWTVQSVARSLPQPPLGVVTPRTDRRVRAPPVLG